MPAAVLAAPFGDGERDLPCGKLHGDLLVGIEHERCPVEHELVLTADLVDIDERPPRLGDPRLRDAVAGLLLAHPIRRAVGNDQDLRARLHQGLAHLLGPDVLADRHAERHAAKWNGRGEWARREHALFVEDAVIRQIVLVADRLDAAVIEQRHGVIDERRLAPRKAHEDGGPAIGRVAGKRLATPPAPPSAAPASAPSPRADSR